MIKWILSRGDIIIGSFDSRQEGIIHLQNMIKQSLKDLKGQEKKNSEFTYNIDFKRIQLYYIELREAYLGL